MVVPRRMPSSAEHGAVRVGDRRDLLLERPASCAAAARSCEATDKRRPLAGDPPLLAIISAPTPWLSGRCTARVTAELIGLPPAAALESRSGPATSSHATGDDDSDWPAMTLAAAIIACCDEPHWRSTVTPGTDSGQPAARTAMRARSSVCSPTWLTAPVDVVDQLGRDTGALTSRSARGRQVHRVDAGEPAVRLPTGSELPRRSLHPLPAPSSPRVRDHFACRGDGCATFLGMSLTSASYWRSPG